MSEEWREYWTPGECAGMQEVLSPEELERELAQMRVKVERFRIALELGFSEGEAALMGALSTRACMKVLGEEGDRGEA